MIDVSMNVSKVLEDVCREFDDVEYYFVYVPADSKLPCIVYSELSNSDYNYYNRMELSQITYSFTIYSTDPEFIFDLRKILDAYLYEAGFLKQNVSQVSYIEPCFMQTFQYSIIVSQKYS